VKARVAKGILYWKVIYEFQFILTTFILTWENLNIRDLQIMAMNIGQLHENQTRESRTFIMDVNKIMCHENVGNSDSKECLGKVCVLGHTVHHLQSCF